jgi:hypothetical protein
LKLAAPAMSALNVEQKEADYYLEYFTERLAGDEIKVTTAGEISALLGFERQKQMMGCSEAATSCMAEMAAALGVDGLIRGSIGKFGERYEVNVKVLSSRNGEVMARYSGSAPSQSAVLDVMATAAKEIRGQLLISADSPSVSGTSRPWVRLVPAVLGAGAIAAGAILWSGSVQRSTALSERNVGAVGSDPDGYAQAARFERALGISLVVAGAVAAAAGVVWFLLWKAPVEPVVAVNGNGAVFGLSGSF